MFNYYDTKQDDIVKALLPLFESKGAYIRRDGKIGIVTRTIFRGPWVHARIDLDRPCTLAHTITHPIFGFIPSKCLNCWKVVIRPKNLDDVFDIHYYQKELRKPSKVGIEVRPEVFGNYGGYWYNDSIEEGLEVREIVQKDYPNLDVFLKRGCTEFERSFGDSRFWRHTTTSRKMEERLNDLLVLDTPAGEMANFPEYINLSTKRTWVEFAYDRGDETYKNYTGGKSLYPGVCKYDFPEGVTGGCQLYTMTK